MGASGRVAARGLGGGLGGGDVGLGEVVAFEEEGFAGGSGEGVGEAVAVVEGGGRAAAAYAEVAPGLPRYLHLVKRYGDELDVQPFHQVFNLEPFGAAGAALDYDGSLQVVRRGHSRMRSEAYRPFIERSFRLAVQYCQ